MMRLPFRASALAVVWLVLSIAGYGMGEPKYVANTPSPNAFPLESNGAAVPLFASPEDWPGVLRAAHDLSDDIQRVTGVQPLLLQQAGLPRAADAVIIGTIGKSPLIDALIRDGKLNVGGIAGKWESAVTTVVEHPMPGIGRALVIAGSDKRGTIYGIYDLSEQIGVSPWYWWADVRIPHRDALFIQPGRYIQPEPAVRYRGIFLNDEAPALSGWSAEKFGGFNSRFYAHVFELLLRLKANYLWPAMWGSAFNEDDLENPRLADEYGIVMGTSHHEPMLRAQQEWKRHGAGPWDYATNAATLDDFWTRGIERNANYESTITLGMRGDGDEPMTEGANIGLLEKIVADQRAILAAHGTPQLAADPKVWALYKEVQEYYEKGMRVPDDVTLLWCDDNWGNIRRLPTPAERNRSGGAGVYYHFDYVGGPRNYKWLNTYAISKVWEQMNLALNYGADRIWIVNVGDLKPLEFPTEFFLDMARTPKRWDKDHLEEFTRDWAAREFGAEHAEEIAGFIDEYTRFNARRKPEQLDPATFSLTHFDEAGRVDADWRDLTARVDRLGVTLPTDEQASYFELVQYPVDASATVAEMYIAAGRNALYAVQGRASANLYAAETRSLFARDAALSARYNGLLNGRWDHMMDQTHIGYTNWQEPPVNAMPAVTETQIPARGGLGIAVDGSVVSGASSAPLRFDSVTRQAREIDLFDRGQEPVSFRAAASAPWIILSSNEGQADPAHSPRLTVQLDWNAVPDQASSEAMVTITPAAGPPFRLAVQAHRLPVTRKDLNGFIESDGYISVEAADTSALTADGAVHWEELPGYGETRSAMTVLPVTAESNLNSTAALEYHFYLTDQGALTLNLVLAPTLNFVPGRGLRLALSMDDGPRQVVDILAHNTEKDWEQAVSDGVKKVSVPVQVSAAGAHTLKIWVVDPGVVLERFTLARKPLPPSYLGPPESFHALQPATANAAP